MNIIKRAAKENILKSLKDMPAVFLNGARQSGKTTLVKDIAENYINANYISFDNISIVSAATNDPLNFVENLNLPVVLDEAQMVPDIFRVLKEKIDNLRMNSKNVNGSFLLTGSANIMLFPKLSDALVGRMHVSTLYPFSGGEISNNFKGFIFKMFQKKMDFKIISKKDNLEDIIERATFPQLYIQKKIDKENWFSSYITTLLQRDAKNIIDIEKLEKLPGMLKLLASRVGCLINDSAWSCDCGINVMTFRRYRILLEQMFLIFCVKPWFRNIGKRLVKSSKIYFTDTCLCCYLLGMNIRDLLISNPGLYGFVIENFIACELVKELSMNSLYSLYHFRTKDRKEVDFVIEKRNGDLIGIEVKSNSSVYAEDFKGLKILAEQAKENFVKGIVLYKGKEIIPFGENLFAVPIDVLWNN